MQIVNFLENYVWGEDAIMNRVRSITNAAVPPARQAELQTIKLDQFMFDMSKGTAGRAASSDELAELALVQQLTQAGDVYAARARADMALLTQAMHYECAQRRLAVPVKDGCEEDVIERATAQVTLDTTTAAALEVVALRSPAAPLALCAMSDESAQTDTPNSDA